jgi:hypothetical protein
MSDDRRKEQRVPASIEVFWEGASGRNAARTSDITTNGCFIDTIARVAVGEVINFKLRLPDEDWIEMEGEVVYAYPNTGFGVRFTDNLSEAARKGLELLITANKIL